MPVSLPLACGDFSPLKKPCSLFAYCNGLLAYQLALNRSDNTMANCAVSERPDGARTFGHAVIQRHTPDATAPTSSLHCKLLLCQVITASGTKFGDTAAFTLMVVT